MTRTRTLCHAPLALGLLALTLGLAACGSQTSPTQDAAEQPAASTETEFVYDGQDHSWSSEAGAGAGVSALTLDAGTNSLSLENWTNATNGWGPVEINQSAGERSEGDGRTLTLAGETYAQGFGVHSASSLTFSLGGQCETFTADVGVDDEVGSKGSVVFQVWADGAKLYDSGVMTGVGATKSVSVDVSGKAELKLVVTDGGDGISHDHADWAAPLLLNCTGSNVKASGEVVYGGPIVITKGGTYSGNWEATENKTAVYIATKEPVVIENANIRSRGNLISGFSNRLTVRNVRGYALNPNVAGKTAGRAINAEEVLNLRVENSYFEGSTGIYVRKFLGDPSQGDSIRILRNRFRNTDGRRSDGNGGYNGTVSVVQAILFNDVKRLPNVEIAWNEIINEAGKSRTEENINFYVSSGTPSSPFLIHDNYIQGAYSDKPTTDTSYPGGGILVGDGKVTDPLDNGYTRVYNNQVVGTTNHGIAIDGGVDNRVYNNRVISSGRLPDGQRLPAANVGLYVWDLHGARSLTPPTFAGNRLENNVVGWTRVLADGKTVNNPTWLPHCGVNGTVCGGNQNIGTVTLEMEGQEYQRWQDKLSANGVKVGP
ncbi:NPCBM/NEW2 domain-containing protein [Deinococcus sp. YIM 134068]|uniref:NPCBM/NEW2 domain-containing protein n=1 Tax=Deinococcus lichenicola TaxID=3118910 RepID=UPI002F91FAFF